MRLPIITIPNPILRKPSQPIIKVDKKILEFIADLEETLLKKRSPQGVGLSAPQVNRSWRIFCTLLPQENVTNRVDLEGKKFVITTFINPQIISASKKLILGNENHTPHATRHEPILEGCLSIPKIYGPVLRHKWVKLKYYTLHATSHELIQQSNSFAGFTARVIQHELDHLDGILFTDRALKQGLPIYEDQRGKLVPIPLT